MDGFQIFFLNMISRQLYNRHHLTLLLCVRERLGRVTQTTSNDTNQQTHMNTTIVKFYSSGGL